MSPTVAFLFGAETVSIRQQDLCLLKRVDIINSVIWPVRHLRHTGF